MKQLPMASKPGLHTGLHTVGHVGAKPSTPAHTSETPHGEVPRSETEIPVKAKSDPRDALHDFVEGITGTHKSPHPPRARDPIVEARELIDSLELFNPTQADLRFARRFLNGTGDQVMEGDEASGFRLRPDITKDRLRDEIAAALTALLTRTAVAATTGEADGTDLIDALEV